MNKLLSAVALFAFVSQPLLAESTNRIFVTNEKGGTVSVINSQTNEIESTIEVGAQPRGIGLSPDGSELYVALGKEDKIIVIDPVSLKVLRDLNSGDDPEAFAVHPNGNLYISNEEDNMATVLNPATGETITQIKVGIEPEGVAVSPDGSRVIVTSESTNMLHVISVPEHEIVANILVGSRPRSATFNKDGSFAYTAAEIGGEVKKVDMATNEVVKVLSLTDDKAKPKDVLLSKDEKTLYVAAGRANAVFALDADTLEIKSEIPVGKRVWGLALNGDGSRLYSTNGVSGTISVIDTATNTVVTNVEVGKFPWGVVVDDARSESDCEKAN
ncbi:MAG: PQQ-dependent catabolism-associated beta-propeller protein [Gammaproteobacteria bacterium]